MTKICPPPAARPHPGSPAAASPDVPTPARLAAANINPSTGLATDYLNHFNEAIMLLDLASTMPECLPDLMAWRPLDYRAHFARSTFKDRALALAAYEGASRRARRDLERLADAMTAILLATRDAMASDTRGAAARAAARAAALLRPLVAQAGAVINGQVVAPDAVDTLFER